MRSLDLDANDEGIVKEAMKALARARVQEQRLDDARTVPLCTVSFVVIYRVFLHKNSGVSRNDT